MDALDDADGPALIEGVARVAEVAGRVAWLAPDQSAGCGSCGAAGGCADKTLSELTGRIAARRFPLTDHPDLRLGERVVVGVRSDALVTAALTAYALPLVALLLTATLAQGLGGGDATTLLASLGGLALGVALARAWALRLAASGATAPRYLRRLGQAHIDLCNIQSPRG